MYISAFPLQVETRNWKLLRVMRAVAIFGPNATAKDVAPFQRAELGAVVTQELAPRPDVDAVLIFGGDGTVHRYLATLVESGVPLLPVPGGSGNDFARSVGLKSRRDALAAWETFCRGGRNVREVDVGVITPLSIDAASGVVTSLPPMSSGPVAGAGSSKLATRNSIPFCCIGGAGLDSETNRRVNRWPASVRAHGGYVLAALREMATWHPLRMMVSVCNPGGWSQRLAEPATFVAFANAPSYGDGMKIAPRAQLDDGLLDVCFVRGTSKRRLLTFFPTVFLGAHLRLPEVEYFQATALRLETERPMDVYADGEYLCKTPVEVRVLPKALRVIVPG